MVVWAGDKKIPGISEEVRHSSNQVLKTAYRFTIAGGLAMIFMISMCIRGG